MARAGFKPAGDRRGAAAVVAGVLVALAGAFAVGRASAPEQVATVEYTDRLVNGVPVGFPGTPRGAGDAAAAYVTSLAASAALTASERQAIVDAVAAPGAGPSVADLVGVPAAQPGGAVISQVLVARVWVPDHDVDAAVPEGGAVSARTLLCALNGAVTDGIVAGPQAGLAGGWYVQDVTLRWVQGRWRVTVAQRLVPVPPPDQRGARRDGSPRDTQPLLEVLSARSWVPGTV